MAINLLIRSKKARGSFVLLIIILTLMYSSFVHVANAAEPPCPFGKLEVPFGGLGETVCQPILTYVGALVKLILGFIIVIATITVVVAGYFYMTAGGNATQVAFAKTLLIAAISGVILAATAYVILNTVSPQFASELREPSIPRN